MVYRLTIERFIMKTQKRIALTGTNSSAYGEWLDFSSADVNVKIHRNVEAVIRTSKGEYKLTKHSVNNIYVGVINGIKVHLTHKAWVGQLIYWA